SCAVTVNESRMNCCGPRLIYSARRATARASQLCLLFQGRRLDVRSVQNENVVAMAEMMDEQAGAQHYHHDSRQGYCAGHDPDAHRNGTQGTKEKLYGTYNC